MVNKIETVAPERQAALGPLSLLMPTPEARVESRADGSLRVTDRLSVDELATYWRDLADVLGRGICERPARVVLVMAGLELPTSIPADAGPVEAASLILVLTRLAPDTVVEAIGHDLACGCGVRIEVARG